MLFVLLSAPSPRTPRDAAGVLPNASEPVGPLLPAGEAPPDLENGGQPEMPTIQLLIDTLAPEYRNETTPRIRWVGGIEGLNAGQAT